ncbi:hypothetical protein [Bradyrhizobium sp. 190]|uniref:ATP dependent DNA ligase n=1 Tax=Bradyrhizobium sp. 190 TaxID=2782658 RepID=UPI0035ABE309
MVPQLRQSGRKATWVVPRFVVDIEFRDITSDGLLRASSFKGLSKGTGRTRWRFTPYDGNGANIGRKFSSDCLGLSGGNRRTRQSRHSG